MVVLNKFWVLLPGVKNEKLGIRLEKNILEERKTKSSCKRHEIMLQTWLEGFLDNQGAFSGDSENNLNDDDVENYNWNIEAFVCRCSSK